MNQTVVEDGTPKAPQRRFVRGVYAVGSPSKRRASSSAPPPALLTAPTRPPNGDLAAWAAAYGAWRAARVAWAAAGGVWPGGEDQRQTEEAIATPDEAVTGLGRNSAE